MRLPEQLPSSDLKRPQPRLRFFLKEQKTSRHPRPSPKTLPQMTEACRQASPQGSHSSQLSASPGQPVGPGKHVLIRGFQTNNNHKIQAEKKVESKLLLFLSEVISF